MCSLEPVWCLFSAETYARAAQLGLSFVQPGLEAVHLTGIALRPHSCFKHSLNAKSTPGADAPHCPPLAVLVCCVFVCAIAIITALNLRARGPCLAWSFACSPAGWTSFASNRFTSHHINICIYSYNIYTYIPILVFWLGCDAQKENQQTNIHIYIYIYMCIYAQ